VDPLATLSAAISRIREPRLFSTERGYQGHLAAELDKLVEGEPDSIARPLVEEEYQKTAEKHGIALRPDIVVHIPFERGVSPTRQHDNYLVILLKLSGTKEDAIEDFNKLETICSVLKYPAGVFVNIATSDLCLPNYARKRAKEFTLYEIAVQLHDGVPKLSVAAQ